MKLNKKAIDLAIKEVRLQKKQAEAEEGRKWDSSDWYGALESEIDAQLYDLEPSYQDHSNPELYLERHVFFAIRKACKKMHPCDPLNDDRPKQW